MLCGGNTDVDGFAANLDEYAPRLAKRRARPSCSAPAARRARSSMALKQRGVGDIRIVNRTLERAVELAASFRRRRFGASASTPCRNCLATPACWSTPRRSACMAIATLPADPDLLPARAIVTDIVYVPLETPLLAAAARRGLKTVDGLGMLLHQAAPGFRNWFGVHAGGHRPNCAHLIVADIERKT